MYYMYQEKLLTSLSKVGLFLVAKQLVVNGACGHKSIFYNGFKVWFIEQQYHGAKNVFLISISFLKKRKEKN